MSEVGYQAWIRHGKVIVQELTDGPMTHRDHVYPSKVAALEALWGRLDKVTNRAFDALQDLEEKSQLVYNALRLAQKELDPQ